MPSRIWLDGTDPNGPRVLRDDKPSTLPIAPPIIPTRHSPALSSTSDANSHATRTPKSRPRPTRRGKSDSRTNSQDPQVISTLIDSFATISFPDTFPDSRPAPRAQKPQRTQAWLRGRSSTPVVKHSKSFDSFASAHAAAHEYVALALKDNLGGIDDAAEPPVVRTAKHPSSFGQTTPHKLKKSGSGSGFNGLGISSGPVSPVDGDGKYSSLLGQNFDEGKVLGHSSKYQHHTKSPTEYSSDVDERTRSMRSKKWSSPNLSKTRAPKPGPRTSSVDAMGGSEVHLHAVDESAQWDFGSATPNATPPATFQEPILDDSQLPLADSAHSPLKGTSGAKRRGKKPASKKTSPALSQGPSVPDRRSSLLHQDIPPPGELELEDIKSMSDGEVKDASAPLLSQNEEPKTLAIELGEDTEVTKRIRELKAKKEQREREARDTPTPDIAESTNGNYINGNTATPKRSKKPIGELKFPARRPSAPANDNRDSFLDEPPSPLTPTMLPINYSFVVDSLNGARPRPSTSYGTSYDSSKDPSDRTQSRPVSEGVAVVPAVPTMPTAAPAPPAIGGRSATSRSIASKSFFGRKDKENSKRAESPDVNGKDRTSLDAASQASKGHHRRSSSIASRRNRWSHPDLPSTVERRTSVKATGILSKREPVHKETVHEERPATPDTVGRAVESFIHAQRLSQKIRHPESGRVVSFSEVGAPKGNVVFCCVGMGLTRYVTAFYDELASTLNLRLITPDRPGVGESQPDPNGTPLSWADDVLFICSSLGVTKFSILAHSAGAIYALATALRIPQHIRGKVHLLAPWIPPSQMETIGAHNDPPPEVLLPKSQRFLRALPAPFLKVANSSFLSATSASLSPNLTPQSRKKRKSNTARSTSPASPSRPSATRRESILLMDTQDVPQTSHSSSLTLSGTPALPRTSDSALHPSALAPPPTHMRSISAPMSPATASFTTNTSSNPTLAAITRDPNLRRAYDERLTLAIWAAATTHANPAVDLLVCLERSQTIGFRYVDITRAVVVHHGAKDSRVPVDNVKWLGGRMRRCEVRVLPDEGHGLMASAGVMGNVLTEMAKEWDDWRAVVGKGKVDG
ncbi:alpha/beta-hydrolase [Microthyrium microscopicum]|uniref:Alpha/beta-hydrolase n=1 Tax=Microthyrium microscopicum TaxID=703497 RepID=A0A6A6U0D2_9PEZI|nr:alpha/beta-hydrolase [Microthyrium microscopicum]